jgi:hypothetical protein
VPPLLSRPHSAVAPQLDIHTLESQFSFPYPHRPSLRQQLPSGHGVEESHCLFCCRFSSGERLTDDIFVESTTSALTYPRFKRLVPLVDVSSGMLVALLLSSTLAMYVTLSMFCCSAMNSRAMSMIGRGGACGSTSNCWCVEGSDSTVGISSCRRLKVSSANCRRYSFSCGEG